MKRIDVTCAIIKKGQKILVCQRGAFTDHPFKWEFPGGKIETNETAEECILREITEEIGVHVNVIEPLISVEYDYTYKQIKLIPFLCKIVDGKINLTEHNAFVWQDLALIHELDFSEADAQLLKINFDLIK